MSILNTEVGFSQEKQVYVTRSKNHIILPYKVPYGKTKGKEEEEAN